MADTDEAMSAPDATVNARPSDIHQRCRTDYEDYGETQGICHHYNDMRHTRGSHPDRETRCVLCYDNMGPEDRTMRHSACKNSGHEKCVIKWLEQNSKCFVCRELLDATEELALALIESVEPQLNFGLNEQAQTLLTTVYQTIMAVLLDKLRALTEQLASARLTLVREANVLKNNRRTLQAQLQNVIRARGPAIATETADTIRTHLNKFDTSILVLETQAKQYMEAQIGLVRVRLGLLNAGLALWTSEEIQQNLDGIERNINANPLYRHTVIAHPLADMPDLVEDDG